MSSTARTPMLPATVAEAGRPAAAKGRITLPLGWILPFVLALAWELSVQAG